MADLPDLNTAEAGQIAYYNIIDNNSISSFDPTELLGSPDIVSYSQYDNGITATIKTPQYTDPVSTTGINSAGSIDGSRDNRTYVDQWVELNMRAKTDGWIVIWWERPHNYNSNFIDNAVDPKGYYTLWDTAIMGDSFNRDYDHTNKVVVTFPNTTAAWWIENNVGYLSNSGSITLDKTNIGYYNYELSSATTLTHAYEELIGFENAGPFSGGISYTSGRTIHYHAFTGGVGAENNSDDITFGGDVYVSGRSGDTRGARDAETVGTMTADGTYYDHGGSAGFDDNRDVTGVIHHTILHS